MTVTRNRKLVTSTAPTKAKSRETSLLTGVYPKQSRYEAGQIQCVRQAGRQAGRQSDGYGGWCLELKRGLGNAKLHRPWTFQVPTYSVKCFPNH